MPTLKTWGIWFSVFFSLPCVQWARNFRSEFPSCFLDICSHTVSRRDLKKKKNSNLKAICIYCKKKEIVNSGLTN